MLRQHLTAMLVALSSSGPLSRSIAWRGPLHALVRQLPSLKLALCRTACNQLAALILAGVPLFVFPCDRTTAVLSLAPAMAGAAAYRPLRLEIEGRAFHSTLFARLHTSKAEDSDLPAQRTLFAVNVPHGATEAGLQAAFERLGAVSEVRLSSMTAEPASSSAAAASPAVTSTAHVVFETAEALKATLKSTKALRLSLETAATKRPTESREMLQKAVDGFLKRFEAEEKKREKEALDAKGKMDADGCARYVYIGTRMCTRIHGCDVRRSSAPSTPRLVDRSRPLTRPLLPAALLSSVGRANL